MRTSTRGMWRIHRLRRQRLALALVGALMLPVIPAVQAQNLPQSGSVSSGSATIGTSGNQMTITQSSQGAIINWGRFDIASGYGVSFVQPSNGVTLNRVLYSGGTFINGSLSANGSVFLISPGGITFGSGAQVNVGSVVASTLDITDADFLSGVSSGHYNFSTPSSQAGAIYNYAPITASNGGTIAFLGAYILNAGSLRADHGSVGLAAAQTVTLDFFGDGLTQVTVAGNGLGIANCSLNCNGGITSSGNVFALGGHIEMRTNTMDGESAGNALFVDPANGGRIWISGNVVARTDGVRQGAIVLDAGMGNIDLGGVEGQAGNIDAVGDNDGEHAGSIVIHGNQLFTHLCVWAGNQCVNNNQIGLLNATAYGAGGNGGAITLDVGRLYHAGWIQAASVAGKGGVIDINAGSAELYSIVTAESSGGQGGSINIAADSLLLHRGQTPWLGGPGTLYSLATLAAFGATSGGQVNLDVGTMSMVDLGNVAPGDVNLDEVYRPTISVNGFSGNGGSIQVHTSSFTLSPWQYFEATGTGTGGNIHITADAIDLAGGLVATGGGGGGVVTTTSPGVLFVGPSANIKADLWRVHASAITIEPAATASPGGAAVLADAAISAALDGGTTIQLDADAALGAAGGHILISDGVSIAHTTNADAALQLQATAGIYGSHFGITSTGGTLDLSFIANFGGSNPDEGSVSFNDFQLTSRGGDIALQAEGRGLYLQYGSILSAGGAMTFEGSGTEHGVSLRDSSLVSGGGVITIRGSNQAASAVHIDTASIASNGGAIVIYGDGMEGVSVVYSTLDSDGGLITMDGDGVFSGVYFRLSEVDSGAGDLRVDGTASMVQNGYYPFGVALAGSSLVSSSGDISVVGHAVGGSGQLFWAAYDNGEAADVYSSFTTDSGAISLVSSGLHGLALGGTALVTNTGDITLTGTATDNAATAAVFVGSGGLSTNGGDITITGTGTTTGVWLYAGDIVSHGGDVTVTGTGEVYGVQVWYNLVSSDAGAITLRGIATGNAVNATGVMVRDASLLATSGGITVNGDADNGRGVFFGTSGSGGSNRVSTTNGAISVVSRGQTGLNVSGIPFSTNTGSIHLEGHALGNGVGLYVGSAGVSTNGGDIDLVGSSAGTYGVLVYGGDLMSHGGDIHVRGDSDAIGVRLKDAEIISQGGGIAIAGIGGSGAGVSLVGSSNVDAGAGLISLSAGNAGTSDAIELQGDIRSTTALVLAPVAWGDAILLGAGNGFSLASAELARLHAPLLIIGNAQHAGAIRVQDAVDWSGDLTLQNQGGNGGIDLQAAVNVGGHVLALASGGSIQQTAAGAITAHSLLAIAAGDVMLTAAANNVAASSVAGKAGGDFSYQDLDDLAIGVLASKGFDTAPASFGLQMLSADGIAAEGAVVVGTDTGNLTLGANVQGGTIDLLAAETFQNPASHVLQASHGWRVWAHTWEGEARGGLQGDGPFDIYGCSFGVACDSDIQGNHFIYREWKPTVLPIAPETVAEWQNGEAPEMLDQGALQPLTCPLGELSDDLMGKDRVSDALLREWKKTRPRLQLNNCIETHAAPGCRF